MTWARIKATGSGKLELRMSIEGLGYEFVTARAMEGTSVQGRERVAGLKRDGITIGESVDIARAELDGVGFTATIVDRQLDSAVTQALAQRPSATTWLDANLTKAATSMSVLSSDEFAVGDVVHIGTEAIYVGGVSAGTLSSLTRGYWGTTAQAHYTADGDELSYPAVHRARPPSIEGRRVSLYAYGEGDDLDDTAEDAGTLLYRGVCLTDARLDANASTWTVEVDSIAKLLQQKLGADLGEPMAPRGIYYPWSAPFHMTIEELAGSNETGVVTYELEVYVVGFFATQEEFIDAVNDDIDVSTWYADSVTAVSDGDQGWHIEYHTDATTARFVRVHCNSVIDPNGRWICFDTDGVREYNVTTNTDYVLRCGTATMSRAGSVPRGYWGPAVDEGWAESMARRQSISPSTYRQNRLYLAGDTDVTVWTRAEITWGDGVTELYSVTNSSAANRFIDLNRPAREDGSAAPYTAGNLPKVRFMRDYGTGSVADFRDGLVTDSPDECNRGRMPLLTAADLADWQAEVVAAARGRRFALVRGYASFETWDLDEFLAHEWRLLGVFPIVDSSGKIAVKRLLVPSQTTSVDASIAEADKPKGGGFVTWERNAFGTINTVTVRSGYNLRTDKHDGQVFHVRDVAALSERKAPRTLEIAPQSIVASFDGETITAAEVADLAQPVLGIFGEDYAVVQVPVTLEHIDTLCGDVVSLTDATIPNVTDGSRGVSGVKGVVVGRVWDLGVGSGTLSVLISYQAVAGYAPSFYVASESGSGTAWTLTLATSIYSVGLVASGDDATNHFQVGDQVRVYTWNTTGPTNNPGEVTAVTATTVSVTFDSTWTPGSSDWILAFDTPASTATDAQAAYVYLGGDDGLVDFSTPTAAYRFGT